MPINAAPGEISEFSGPGWREGSEFPGESQENYGEPAEFTRTMLLDFTGPIILYYHFLKTS